MEGVNFFFEMHDNERKNIPNWFSECPCRTGLVMAMHFLKVPKYEREKNLHHQPFFRSGLQTTVVLFYFNFVKVWL
jgi:hypothetical protein